VQVQGVKYRPPGTAINLLNDVSLSLSEKRYHAKHVTVIPCVSAEEFLQASLL